MITTKMQYRRKKLTLAQKALKKAVTNVAKELKSQIRGDMPRTTGTLRLGLTYKVVSKNGHASAIIGVQTKYSRIVKPTKRPRKPHEYVPHTAQEYKPAKVHSYGNIETNMKIPNLYARKVNAKYGFIGKYVNSSAVEKLRNEVKQLIKEMK